MWSIPVILFSLTAAWLAVELRDPTILLGWFDFIVVPTDSEMNPWQDVVKHLRQWLIVYE